MRSTMALQALLDILAISSLAAASCAHGTFIQPRLESGVHVSNFSYAGVTGPLNWASLEPVANALCANGTHQSPIDLTSGTYTTLPAPSIRLRIPDMPRGSTFANLGTTIEVMAPEGDAAGTLVLRNESFAMKQFHFHLPSEHLEDGHSHAMEMHMVFQSARKELAVIGTYIVVTDSEEGAQAAGRGPALSSRGQRNRMDPRGLLGASENPSGPSMFLETVFDSVGEIGRPGSWTTTKPLRMSELVHLFMGGSFQTYSGSLTSPPCSEGVTWMMSTQKLGVKATTFERVRSVLGFSSRFTQNAPGDPNLMMLAVGTSVKLGLYTSQTCRGPGD